MKKHTDAVTSLVVLSKNRLVSGSQDMKIKVWTSLSWNLIKTLNGHSSTISALAVLPTYEIVSGSLDTAVRVWPSIS